MPFRTAFLLNAGLPAAAVVAAVAVVSSSAPSRAETVEPQLQSAPVQVIEAPATPVATPAVISAQAAEPAPIEAVETATIAPTAADRVQAECIAKVIMHEAAYEPRAGRIAVAQVMHNRTRDGRFARDVCAVARQRGQFFNIDAFNPRRDANWDDAVEIAHDVLSEREDQVAPGALFFHAAYSPMRGRARVAQIGGHVFYR